MSDGFGTRESSGMWCRVGNGKVIRSATQETPNAVKVPKVDKKGVSVLGEDGKPQFKYELQNDYVEGYVVGIKNDVDTFEEQNIPKMVVVLRTPGGSRINLQIKEGNRYWHSFVNSIPNIDFMKPVRISPFDYVSRKDNKRKQGIGVQQNGKDVPWAFGKDKPGGPPQLEKMKRADGTEILKDGKPMWDWEPIVNWLHANVITPAQFKVKEITDADEAAGRPVQEHREVVAAASQMPEDDAFPGGDADMDPDSLPF